jgi:NAD(P)-dependent dehydrogenase (short-subunit alcohol dehydrogenase family)
MSEQVVLITGALTGSGRATAIAFARKGAKIVVSGRHDKQGQKLVIELRDLGAEAEFVRADVRQEADIEKQLTRLRDMRIVP